jgi:Ca2+-binding EF-hand superfamily protein
MNNGLLAYDEFCNVFATMGSGNNPNVNPVFKLMRSVPEVVLKKVMDIIKKRGETDKVDDAFKVLDKNLTGVLDREGFVWGLKQLGVVLPKVDLDRLFAYYDKYCDDNVQYG